MGFLDFLGKAVLYYIIGVMVIMIIVIALLYYVVSTSPNSSTTIQSAPASNAVVNNTPAITASTVSGTSTKNATTKLVSLDGTSTTTTPNPASHAVTVGSPTLYNAQYLTISNPHLYISSIKILNSTGASVIPSSVTVTPSAAAVLVSTKGGTYKTPSTVTTGDSININLGSEQQISKIIISAPSAATTASNVGSTVTLHSATAVVWSSSIEVPAAGGVLPSSWTFTLL